MGPLARPRRTRVRRSTAWRARRAVHRTGGRLTANAVQQVAHLARRLSDPLEVFQALLLRQLLAAAEERVGEALDDRQRRAQGVDEPRELILVIRHRS